MSGPYPYLWFFPRPICVQAQFYQFLYAQFLYARFFMHDFYGRFLWMIFYARFLWTIFYARLLCTIFYARFYARFLLTFLTTICTFWNLAGLGRDRSQMMSSNFGEFLTPSPCIIFLTIFPDKITVIFSIHHFWLTHCPLRRWCHVWILP